MRTPTFTISLGLFCAVLLSSCTLVSENLPSASQLPSDLEMPQHEEVVQEVRQEHGVQTIPILMFHYVREVDQTADPLGWNLSIDPKTFEAILKSLSDQGYQSIHLSEVEDGMVPEHAVILTFDDGYEDFYTTAMPILERYQFTASVAVVTDMMDGELYMSPEQVQEIDQKGFEILSHTVHHLDLTTIDGAESEIGQSQTYLEELLKKPVTGFVYPAGKYNDETIRLLKDAGYVVGLTTKSGCTDLSKDSLFELPRVRIDNRDSLDRLLEKLAC